MAIFIQTNLSYKLKKVKLEHTCFLQLSYDGDQYDTVLISACSTVRWRSVLRYCTCSAYFTRWRSFWRYRHSGNRLIRRSPYDGGRYGAVLVVLTILIRYRRALSSASVVVASITYLIQRYQLIGDVIDLMQRRYWVCYRRWETLDRIVDRREYDTVLVALAVLLMTT